MTLATDTIFYNGKTYTVPILSDEECFNWQSDIPQVQKDIHTIWDLEKFKIPRKPMWVAQLSDVGLQTFSKPGLPRILDMPIKFPGTNYRVPKGLEQLQYALIQMIRHEELVNPHVDEYYAYLTVDQGPVKKNTLQREAPCHVDGFQGARQPKTYLNHSYIVGNVLPTAFYVQPFDFSLLDETKHNFFWEMNRQVALTNAQYQWQPKAGEIVLMDGYCVHRGVDATEDCHRTWIRLSYETRVFDRLGNAHNPCFDYNWEMVERDIEQLNLVAFDPTCDESLRKFPWEKDTNGNKTQPRLNLTGKGQPYYGG